MKNNFFFKTEPARQRKRADEELTKFRMTLKETSQIPINTSAYNFAVIKEDARIRVKQDTDVALYVIKRQLMCEEYTIICWQQSRKPDVF